MPDLNYGYQFRRFGVHTRNNMPRYRTQSVYECPGWVSHTKQWRECAFMGLKVEWHPAVF
jgi:hypothetical protein